MGTEDGHGNPANADATRRALDEHRECLEVVARLEGCLDRQPGGSAGWIAETLEALRTLQETLRCHFGREQQGPLYSELPVNRPRFAARLQKLKEEHGRILENVGRALERGERLGEPERYELREFNAELQLLVATIRRHEAEENEILLEANWDEVGVGD